MRTLRHNEKTKSLTSTQPCTSSSPKQIKLAKEVSNNVMSADEHYEEHVAEMKREFEKQKPDQVHLKQLIKQTFRKRREWISNQPSGQTKAIVEEFPWIVKRSNVSTLNSNNIGHQKSYGNNPKNSDSERLLHVIQKCGLGFQME